VEIVGSELATSHSVEKRPQMHVVVRSYSGQGSSELFDLLEQREGDVENLIAGVPGFVSYVAFRSGGDTGMTVTVCQDKEGTDESSRRAAEWVKDNVSTPGTPPEIAEGQTVLQFRS
jgi:hypothetical protein